MSDANGIPKYLRSTYDMLQCAFPFGVSDEQLMPLLKVLYRGGMSFENAARVMSFFLDRSDIEMKKLTVDAQRIYSDEDIRLVQVIELLEQCGYSEWLLSD